MKNLHPLARVLLCALAVTAGAETKASPGGAVAGGREWKRRFENTFAFVANPLGIQDAFEVSWTKPINRSDALLYKDAHLAAGAVSKLTPAFERLGAWFEYSPLSVLDLRVGVEPVYYFGTYKVFLPFDRASARFDDNVIEARVKEASPGFAGRVYVSPTLKARVGATMARVRAELGLWKAQKKGEPFYYEPAWDTLIKASGSRVLALEALALREFKLSDSRTLLLGPVYDLTTVSDAAVNRKQDIGVLAVWSKSGAFHALKDPTLAAKGYYFLKDPWRRHQAALQLAFVFGL
ncbi:MAG: hypothetical protein ABI565_00985 [Vicinamibacteria bacterium]